jgi:hypothetical protein
MRHDMRLTAAVALALTLLTACVTGHAAGASSPAVPAPAPRSSIADAPGISCGACATIPLDSQFIAAIGARIAELKSRGGDCEVYAGVLDHALSNGLITIRPYMWRVGSNLASAQGESNGELTLARDIDSLNVGVRALDDMLLSAEHEAVHIASRIPSGTSVGEMLVDERVRACQQGTHR